MLILRCGRSIGVADVEHPSGIALEANGLPERTDRRASVRNVAAVVQRADSFDIILSFSEVRNSGATGSAVRHVFGDNSSIVRSVTLGV